MKVAFVCCRSEGYCEGVHNQPQRYIEMLKWLSFAVDLRVVTEELAFSKKLSNLSLKDVVKYLNGFSLL